MKTLVITLSAISVVLFFAGCASSTMTPIPNTDTYTAGQNIYNTVLATTAPASTTPTAGTTTLIPTTSQPTPTHTLALIQTFTGSGITNTPTFQIPTGVWQINWSEIPANQYNLMSYTVYQPGNSMPLDVGSGTTANGSSSEYFGPGTYYISVEPANIASWTIQVYG